MTRRMTVNDDDRRRWTLAAMCFALFMVMLDNTVVNVALASIQRDLHASLAGLEWTVNAYTLAFAVLLVTGGRLAAAMNAVDASKAGAASGVLKVGAAVAALGAAVASALISPDLAVASHAPPAGEVDCPPVDPAREPVGA